MSDQLTSIFSLGSCGSLFLFILFRFFTFGKSCMALLVSFVFNTAILRKAMKLVLLVGKILCAQGRENCIVLRINLIT